MVKCLILIDFTRVLRRRVTLFLVGLLQTSWKFLGAGKELATNVLLANALKFWHGCPTAGASLKGVHSVVPKRVTHECPTNVSLKKVSQQCFKGVSSMTELQECPARARLTWRVCLKESLTRMLQPDGVCSSISFQPVICIPVRGSYWTLVLFTYIYRHLPVHRLYTYIIRFDHDFYVFVFDFGRKKHCVTA